ncbi:MAG: hypothetical protein WAM82_22845 [Thermoanaerobaculia bacterium]
MLAGICLEVETEREVLATTLCLLEERPEVEDFKSLHLLLRSGGSLDLGFVGASSRNPGFCTLDFTWRLAKLPIEDAELEAFKRDLLENVLSRVKSDSRAS